MKNKKTTSITGFTSENYFLSILVYKFPLGKCGGVTDDDNVKSIYIPCATGPTKYSDIIRRDEEHLIFIPEYRGRDYWSLVPVIRPSGLLGPFSGGNIAYSSDDRCEHVYHIHDRFESEKVYNALSI